MNTEPPGARRFRVAYCLRNFRSFVPPPPSHQGQTAPRAILVSRTPASLPARAPRENPHLPPALHRVWLAAKQLRETPPRAGLLCSNPLPEKLFPSLAPRSDSPRPSSPPKNPSAPSSPAKARFHQVSRPANPRATTPPAADWRAAISPHTTSPG